MNFPFRYLLSALVITFALSTTSLSAAEKPSQSPLNVIIMDPLAAPLACDCVQGYAQRKYEKLATYLESTLKRPVHIAWGGSLDVALKDEAVTNADLIVGKHSVVLSDAKKENITVKPIAHLTGKDGRTTQTGLIVVRAKDKAKSLKDLAGYRIFFGPQDNEEKHAAPMALLKNANVKLPSKIETYPACSNAATALLELEANINAAAVISSYAEPLLEGCGSIKKGDLRVLGESAPVPFVSAFLNTALSESEKTAVEEALFDMIDHPKLLMALETSIGFLPTKESLAAGKKKE